MRTCALSYLARVACAVSVSALLAIGPIGCDGGSGQGTAPAGPLPPEAKKANENMENFMKNQPPK